MELLIVTPKMKNLQFITTIYKMYVCDYYFNN